MNPEVEICRTFSPYYVNNYSVSFHFSLRLGTSQWIFQEYHYDCVLDANEARNLRKQDEKNKEKKKKERKDKEKEKKGFMGYNLAHRRPGEGYLKHKYAAEEKVADGPIKDYFIETVMSSHARRSNRKRKHGLVCHAYAMRLRGVATTTCRCTPKMSARSLYLVTQTFSLGISNIWNRRWVLNQLLKIMRCKTDSLHFHLIVLPFGMLQAHCCRT